MRGSEVRFLSPAPANKKPVYKQAFYLLVPSTFFLGIFLDSEKKLSRCLFVLQRAIINFRDNIYFGSNYDQITVDNVVDGIWRKCLRRTSSQKSQAGRLSDGSQCSTSRYIYKG